MDNEISELSGPSEVDRVITQEETRTYNVKSVLGYLDSPVLDKFELLSNTMIPVNNDDGKLIGFANVTIVKNCAYHALVADINIDYSTPERLVAETGDGVKYYPRIVGTLMVCHPYEKNYPFVELSGDPVSKLLIKSIVLSTVAPKDERLYPLGKPIVVQ